MLNEIMRYIIKSYDSLERLNYKFTKQYTNSPLSPEFKIFKNRVEKDFEIFDFTEINTDVANMAEIKNDSGHWCIYMSWVGPFASLVRLKTKDQPQLFLDPLKNNLSSSEVFLIDEIQKLGFKIPDENTLLTKIKTGPVNPDRDCSYVYELLFTENEIFNI